MTRVILSFTLLLVIMSCKQSSESKTQDTLQKQELTTAEAIAAAHGIEHWAGVKELQFTFNIDRGESHFERSFIWNPRNEDVTYISGADTLKYNRNDELDSLSLAADQRFINDSYWLLSPFKLVWDQGTSISESGKVQAPCTKDSLNSITLRYADDVGYTPGDAYDFFFNDDFVIKEWVYRRGNADSPSMMTKWEKISDIEGLKLATSQVDSTGNFRLYFTNLSVKK